jgi:hypothetical protein
LHSPGLAAPGLVGHKLLCPLCHKHWAATLLTFYRQLAEVLDPTREYVVTPSKPWNCWKDKRPRPWGHLLAFVVSDLWVGHLDRHLGLSLGKERQNRVLWISCHCHLLCLLSSCAGTDSASLLCDHLHLGIWLLLGSWLLRDPPLFNTLPSLA